eukprot:2335519-Amphidinium_carterae.1
MSMPRPLGAGLPPAHEFRKDLPTPLSLQDLGDSTPSSVLGWAYQVYLDNFDLLEVADVVEMFQLA